MRLSAGVWRRFGLLRPIFPRSSMSSGVERQFSEPSMMKSSSSSRAPAQFRPPGYVDIDSPREGPHRNNNNNNRRLTQACPSFCVCTCEMDPSEQPVTGPCTASKVVDDDCAHGGPTMSSSRIAAALATSLHTLLTSTEDGQGREEEESELHNTDEGPEDSSSPTSALQPERRRARREGGLSAWQSRRGPQERVQRHTMEHITDLGVRVAPMGADPRCSCAADGGQAA